MNPIEYASLPAPLWLITSLHILTLTLHLLAMNIVVGGIVIGLFGRFSDRWQHPFVTQLVKLLPTMMAATVTLGVAPLLFVQVVYGRFIYSASIISGWFWLMIFVAAILGYYCLYAAAFSKKGKARTGVYLGSALVCFVYISYVYSSVFALTERPDLQAILYAANQSGLILNNDVGSYLYRWLHVLAGAVTVGGFFVAALGRHNEEAFAAGKLFFLWGMIVASVLGVAYMMSCTGSCVHDVVWRIPSPVHALNGGLVDAGFGASIYWFHTPALQASVHDIGDHAVRICAGDGC